MSSGAEARTSCCDRNSQAKNEQLRIGADRCRCFMKVCATGATPSSGGEAFEEAHCSALVKRHYDLAGFAAR